MQIVFFVLSFLQLWESHDYEITKNLVSVGFPFARASANLINLNSAVAVISTARNLITILRSFPMLNKLFPFDSHLEMHIVSVIGIIFWSIMHVIGHSFNYFKISNWAGISLFKLLLLPTGLTGIILGLLLILMILFSIPVVRRKYFHIFYAAHYLFVPFLLISSFHGAFCFIKNDNEMRSFSSGKNKSEIFSNNEICAKGSSFWKWVIGPFTIYLLEKLFRVWRSHRKVEIKKVVQHPSNTVEIQLSKVGRLKAGQYAFISCPEIGFTEWHPFTVSSSPLDPYLSFHIRVVGDWTRKFAERLGCDYDNVRKTISRKTATLPKVKIDGFYGAPAEDVFNFNVAILIGAGIGVTPFASILKEIWIRYRNSDKNLRIPKKVFFIWIAKDTQSFEWFQSLLMDLEENGVSELVEISIYLTQRLDLSQIRNITLNRDRKRDVITGLDSRTQFGRPNFDVVFQKISRSYPGTDVGVFCCGSKGLSDSVGEQCTKYTHSVKDGIRFHYMKENF